MAMNEEKRKLRPGALRVLLPMLIPVVAIGVITWWQGGLAIDRLVRQLIHPTGFFYLSYFSAITEILFWLVGMGMTVFFLYWWVSLFRLTRGMKGLPGLGHD